MRERHGCGDASGVVIHLARSFFLYSLKPRQGLPQGTEEGTRRFSVLGTGLGGNSYPRKRSMVLLMRIRLFVMSFMILSSSCLVEAGYVKGHYRKNGTYVAPHYRKDTRTPSYRGTGIKSGRKNVTPLYRNVDVQSDRKNTTPQINRGTGNSSVRSSEYELTITRMKKIEMAISAYKNGNAGKLPNALSALYESSSGMLLMDGWGNRFAFKHVGNGYVLKSCGPDQLMGTGDDIISPNSSSK